MTTNVAAWLALAVAVLIAALIAADVLFNSAPARAMWTTLLVMVVIFGGLIAAGIKKMKG